MTTYDHTHPGSSLPLTRPGVAQPVTYTGAWKDLLAILAVAIVVVAAFIGVFAVAGTSSTTTAVHHGGAHGRANILFKQKLSGPMQTTGGTTASAAVGIVGEQVSGPMSVEKLRLARHDVFGRNDTVRMVQGVTGVSGNESHIRPSSHVVTGGRTVAHVSLDSSIA